MTELAKSRVKRRCLGKSPITLLVSLVVFDYMFDDTSASKPSEAKSRSKMASKNMKNNLKIGKEQYLRLNMFFGVVLSTLIFS